MGYGVPSAVAIKRLHPERTVISLNGDGDFLMNGQEFATAVQYKLPIICIICDNASYGTIRMHQERDFPGRVASTDLVNPDFAAYAKAFGGFGATVERTADFPAALAAAQASGQPSIIHLKISTDAILPGMTLTAIRDKSLRRADAARAVAEDRGEAGNRLPASGQSAVREIPIERPRLRAERAGLERHLVERRDWRDLGEVADVRRPRRPRGSRRTSASSRRPSIQPRAGGR